MTKLSYLVPPFPASGTPLAFCGLPQNGRGETGKARFSRRFVRRTNPSGADAGESPQRTFAPSLAEFSAGKRKDKLSRASVYLFVTTAKPSLLLAPHKKILDLSLFHPLPDYYPAKQLLIHAKNWSSQEPLSISCTTVPLSCWATWRYTTWDPKSLPMPSCWVA